MPPSRQQYVIVSDLFNFVDSRFHVAGNKAPCHVCGAVWCNDSTWFQCQSSLQKSPPQVGVSTTFFVTSLMAGAEPRAFSTYICGSTWWGNQACRVGVEIEWICSLPIKARDSLAQFRKTFLTGTATCVPPSLRMVDLRRFAVAQIPGCPFAFVRA